MCHREGVSIDENDAERRTEPPPEPRTGTHHRNPLTWLVAAAAVAVIVAVAAFVLRERDSVGTSATPSGGADQQSATVLTAAAAEQGRRCLPPSPRVLRGADHAFDGVVTRLEDGTATLATSHWYAGQPTRTVTVRAPSADMQALLAAVRFEKGRRYLVAASDDGRVMLCGFSAAYSERLARLYLAAFEG